jgi:hypothetical protein
MLLRSSGCAVLLLVLAPSCARESGRQEPGSFRLDPASGKIADGKRHYAQADAAQVIRLVITDWMTNPNVKDQPYRYLIDRDNETGKDPKPKLERLLIDDRYVPEGFDLKIKGVKIGLFDRSKRDLRKGEMCIRVDRFEPKKDGSIEVEFLHAGYGIIGGAWVTYRATKVKDNWSVEFSGSFDP